MYFIVVFSILVNVLSCSTIKVYESKLYKNTLTYSILNGIISIENIIEADIKEIIGEEAREIFNLEISLQELKNINSYNRVFEKEGTLYIKSRGRYFKGEYKVVPVKIKYFVSAESYTLYHINYNSWLTESNKQLVLKIPKKLPRSSTKNKRY
jgi:hypothetical protein